MEFRFNKIEEAIKDVNEGKFVIVVDDEDRENEGDLILASEKVAPDKINFMAKYGRGLICVALGEERLNELKLFPMVNDNTALKGTPFTVSVDAREGTTTGISAYDRARTVQVLIDRNATPEDLAKPGHIFPLKAADGGVLKRSGHTEASVDLASLAGLYPSGVLCEIMDEDGKMARVTKLFDIARQHNIKICTIADLIQYRRRRERLVEKVSQACLPTIYGDFKLIMYRCLIHNLHHVALVMGEVRKDEPFMVRVHSQCLTGDVFSSLRCDCGEQLKRAMEIISENGSGAILYMCQEGRGIGLPNKIKAYSLQDEGLDTVEANRHLGFPADLRDYGVGAQILVDLNISKIKLLTNNPKKIIGLEGYGLEVVERIPITVKPNDMNEKYLMTKKEKLGHIL